MFTISVNDEDIIRNYKADNMFDAAVLFDALSQRFVEVYLLVTQSGQLLQSYKAY